MPKTTIDLRRLPAALSLGLPAALLAHIATFGNQHVAGGASHGVLLALGASLVAAAVAAGWLLAWTGSRVTADGSVLAERLGRFVPSYVQLLAAAGAAFALVEWLEPRHGLAPLVLPALAVTVWLARTIVVGMLRILAAIAVAIAPGELRAPAPLSFRLIEATPLAMCAPLRGRLVARAPPIT